MQRTPLMTRASGLALMGALLALAGCNQAAPPASTDQAPTPLAALPLTDDTAPQAAAPLAAALPAAPPARVGRLARPQDRYAYLDRAHQMGYGFGDAPPDYAFDYDGARPWAWQSDDGYQTVVEPLPGGGRRYYYYDRGSQQPFLVRDGDESYGYNNGVLIAVYGRDGRDMGYDYAQRRADFAGRFLFRAEQLFDASRHHQHFGVPRGGWQERRREIDADQAQWDAARDADADWRAYHQQHADQDDAHWANERYRRETEAAHVDQSFNDAQAVERDRKAAQKAATIAHLPQIPSRGPGPAVQTQPVQPIAPVGPQGPAGGKHLAPAGPTPLAPVVQGPLPGRGHGPLQGQVTPGRPNPAVAARQAQLQAQAQARATAQAQAEAARQAQIKARQDQAQAAAARQAELRTQRQGQQAAQAQAAAARQAEIKTRQTQAQGQAAQAAAARQVELRTQRQGQQAAQAQAAAARQAEIRTRQTAVQAQTAKPAVVREGPVVRQTPVQPQGQGPAQAQAARQAAAAARAKAKADAEAKKHPAQG
jgi:hypothetical protein